MTKENHEVAHKGKDGHRKNALELIDEAIQEVQKGIQAGNMWESALRLCSDGI